MKFYFPDSHDYVDPNFDFDSEEHGAARVRQRREQYAHELLDPVPYDGILVSKAIVDGARQAGAAGARSGRKYTAAQRYRLEDEGVRAFLRLDARRGGTRLEAIGDCGAFTYIAHDRPPYTVESVAAFYGRCGFDAGISVDHVIKDYEPEWDAAPRAAAPLAFRERQDLTLGLAEEFLRVRRACGYQFEPIGVAQGWSPQSYADAVAVLQRQGYTRIALGGLASRKDPDLFAVLAATEGVRRPTTRLHLLGVERVEHVQPFGRYGVASFDSTSPLRRAFKDGDQNYFTLRGTYSAVRVPQVEGNQKLRLAIRAGRIDQRRARRLEQGCLDALRRYDAGAAGLPEVLDLLREYELLYDTSRADRTDAYRRVLTDRPWSECSCAVCRTLGIHVIIYRGAQRNKQRGFHNLTVLHQQLSYELAPGAEPAYTDRAQLVAEHPVVVPSADATMLGRVPRRARGAAVAAGSAA